MNKLIKQPDLICRARTFTSDKAKISEVDF